MARREPQNQAELVRERVTAHQEPIETTEVLRLPGIEVLHTRSYDEIARTLTNAVRARPHVKRLVYNVGKDITITYDRIV